MFKIFFIYNKMEYNNHEQMIVSTLKNLARERGLREYSRLRKAVVSCSLKYRKPNFTPVVFHNHSGYDSHLFIKNLGFNEGNIHCIPNIEERYISFTKKIQVGSYTKKEETKPLHHQIRFIDSFEFMATSLDKLVNNLPKDAFNNIKRYYADNKLSLLTRKGVYPYEYMNSPERLKETQLPPKEAFYSRLNDEVISDENYAHA